MLAQGLAAHEHSYMQTRNTDCILEFVDMYLHVTQRKKVCNCEHKYKEKVKLVE